MEIFMEYYYIIEAIIGIVVGIWLAVHTKKAEDVTYGKLDKAGRIVNVVLIVFYVLTLPLYIFISAIFRPAYDGFLGFLGYIVSIIGSSVALYCALGLGASVALRKKGKSKLSFAVQFAGVAGIILMFILFFAFYGNLLDTIN